MNPRAVLIASDWSGSAKVLMEAQRKRPSQIATRKIWTIDLLVLNRFQTSTVLARRAQLDELHGFRSDLDGAEDWDMWLRLSRLGEVVIVQEPLVYYRDTEGGYSKNLMRLMTAMQKMMAREYETGSVNPRLLRKLLTWHYLRFSVGFALIKDKKGTQASLVALAKDGLASQIPSATWSYLLPFLAMRLRRRIRHHNAL